MGEEQTALYLNRKFKLTNKMVNLYTMGCGIAFFVFCLMFTFDGLGPEEFVKLVKADLYAWTLFTFLFGGWYVGMNVLQKWSPK